MNYQEKLDEMVLIYMELARGQLAHVYGRLVAVHEDDLGDFEFEVIDKEGQHFIVPEYSRRLVIFNAKDPDANG